MGYGGYDRVNGSGDNLLKEVDELEGLDDGKSFI